MIDGPSIATLWANWVNVWPAGGVRICERVTVRTSAAQPGTSRNIDTMAKMVFMSPSTPNRSAIKLAEGLDGPNQPEPGGPRDARCRVARRAGANQGSPTRRKGAECRGVEGPKGLDLTAD